MKGKTPRLKARLDPEDALWKTELGKDRHRSGQPARLLHTHEMLDAIIEDPDKLYRLTRNTGEIFDDTLEDLIQVIKKSKNAPHFRDDYNRRTESGNQCKLYTRHFLLLYMIRQVHNPTQDALGTFFGIDQGTMSRYLSFARNHENELSPVTPDNITRYVTTIKTEDEFKEIIPGRGGGELTVDGTLVQATRPADKDERKIRYLGKKKAFVISTGMLINKNNYIMGITDSREGSCHDMAVFTEGLPDFGRWLDCMIDGQRIPNAHRIRLNADCSYIGIEKYLSGITAKLPHKKPKGGKLTATQKAQNKAHSTRRVPVEHVFAHVKKWRRIAGRYDGTTDEFNGICGIYNKRKMWSDGTYCHWKDKILSQIVPAAT